MRGKIDATVKRGRRASSHAVQPAVDAAGIVGEEDDLAHIVGKLHQVEVIDGTQQRVHKMSCRLLFQTEVFLHTAAGVNGQDNLQRQFGLALEDSDFLRMFIFGEDESRPE